MNCTRSSFIFALASAFVTVLAANGERRDAPGAAGDCYTECCGDCKVILYCAVNSEGLGTTSSECTSVTPDGVGGYCCKDVQPSAVTAAPTASDNTGGNPSRSTKAPSSTNRGSGRNSGGTSSGNEGSENSRGENPSESEEIPENSSAGSGPSSTAPSTTTTKSSPGGTLEPTIEVDEDGSACLHADMLRDHDSRDLVHKKHVLTRVLCFSTWDVNESKKRTACATKHHRVIYNGRTLSMAQFCSEPSENRPACTETVAPVNNVLTHLHGHRLVMFRDLTFTHYDSRFPEWAQRLIHRVIEKVRA